MKYHLLPATVVAFCFDGSPESAESAKEWLSSLDVENVELTWQRERPSFDEQAELPTTVALYLTTAWGLRTLEAGEWLIYRDGLIYVETAAAFAAAYQPLAKKGRGPND